MLLCFVRHAIAADRESWNEKDEKRPLTSKGIKKMKRVAGGLSLLEKDFTHICTSPLRRARQTAKILARKSKYSGEVLVWNELVPDKPPKSLEKKLQALSRNSKSRRPKLRSASRRAAAARSQKIAGSQPSTSPNSVTVALVGHEPQLSQAVSYFLCGDPDKMSIAFKKSGICCVEYDGKIPATLHWFVPPRVSRHLS